MTTVTTQNNTLIAALQNSLYVGAKAESIQMVLDYCQVAGLDPMQKPVHIVPMSVKNPISGQYEWRDVVMPGINLYRTNAVATGQYAGISEPEFGEEVSETFPEEKDDKKNTKPAVTVEYPKWCKVTVKRLMPNGTMVEFTAKELWKENYATAGKWMKQPNSMWVKRPFAQLAKCTEAQALRKAFPEFGAQATAEEMEGKFIDADIVAAKIQAPLKNFEELQSGLEPLGINLSFKDGMAYASGNTYANSKTLQQLGFKVENNIFCINTTAPVADASVIEHKSEVSDEDTLASYGLSMEKKRVKDIDYEIIVGDADSNELILTSLGFQKGTTGKWGREVIPV